MSKVKGSSRKAGNLLSMNPTSPLIRSKILLITLWKRPKILLTRLWKRPKIDWRPERTVLMMPLKISKTEEKRLEMPSVMPAILEYGSW